MWASTTSRNTLQAIAVALNDPRFFVGNQARFSMEDISAYIATKILAHNQMMSDLMSEIAFITGQRDWPNWTGGSPVIFRPKAEGNRPALQDGGFAPQISGALLRADEAAFGMTEEAARMIPGPQFRQKIDDVMDGDKYRIIRDILTRLLIPTEETAQDHRTDYRMITSLGLANGDSWLYPRGLYGKAVSASHNHYNYIAGGALAAGDLDALIVDVREHGYPSVEIWCAPTDEGVFTGIQGFVPAQYDGTVPADNTVRIDPSLPKRTQEDASSTGKVFVGRYKGVNIYSLWWWPVNYLYCQPTNLSPDAKPLAVRVFSNDYTLGSGIELLGNMTDASGVVRPGLGDLRAVSSNGTTFFTIFDVRHFEREIGVGTRNRTGAAILSLASGGAYVAPNVGALIVN
jgi:hypothetical protein